MKIILSAPLALGLLCGLAGAQFWPAVTTTTNMGTWSSYNILNLTNGQGLSSMALAATHSSAFQDMWLSNSITTGWVEFDLGSPQVVKTIALWNYNSSINLARGVARMDVYVSLNGSQYTLLSRETPPIGTAQPLAAHLIQAGVPARFVKFDILQNHGDLNYTGMSEVQFMVSSLQPQAAYPLLTDLLDTTTNYGPVTLTGNPTPPAPPANGVCVNGIYSMSAGGQDVRTPLITSLDTNDFQVDVEFYIAALPTSYQNPVFMCGNSYRWLGIYVQPSGILGLKYNNSNFTWSTTAVRIATWYIGSIRYEAGTVELVLNGRRIHQLQIGALNTGNNLNFTTNDFSNGRSHNGCIRNIVISNDTTLGNSASATKYGNGCGGLTQDAKGIPKLGTPTFALTFSNQPTVNALVFVALAGAPVNPGIDLTGLGMPGCFSFTSFNFGLFGPAMMSAGAANFPLPIPNNPSLVAAVLFTQGISMLTGPTPGWAASNGMQLVVGL